MRERRKPHTGTLTLPNEKGRREETVRQCKACMRH